MNDKQVKIEMKRTELDQLVHDRIKSLVYEPGPARKRLVHLDKNSVFGAPQEHDQFTSDVFVIMPFSDEFTSIYTDHIKKKIEGLEYSIKRGDDFFSNNSIMSDVWSAIFNAKLIIADCSGRNTNVFYELGIAHALNKTAIMLTQDINDIPFDVQHLRVIVYENTKEGLVNLENAITDVVEKAFNPKQMIKRKDDETAYKFVERVLNSPIDYVTNPEEINHFLSMRRLFSQNLVPRLSSVVRLTKNVKVDKDDLLEAFTELDTH